MRTYYIESLTDSDDETGKPLTWSNLYGWSIGEATLFSEEEHARLSLPIGGQWVINE